MKKSLFKILAATGDIADQELASQSERGSRHAYDDAESDVPCKRFKHSLRDLRGGRHPEKKYVEETQMDAECEDFWRVRNAA